MTLRGLRRWLQWVKREAGANKAYILLDDKGLRLVFYRGGLVASKKFDEEELFPGNDGLWGKLIKAACSNTAESFDKYKPQPEDWSGP